MDFGTEGASHFMLRAKGEGTVEIFIGRKGGQSAATFNISSDELSDYTVDADASRLVGTKTIYIAVTSGTNVYVDAWQALMSGSDGIQQVENDTAVKTSDGYYNIAGQRIDPSAHYRGIIIHNGNKYIAR